MNVIDIRQKYPFFLLHVKIKYIHVAYTILKLVKKYLNSNLYSLQ